MKLTEKEKARFWRKVDKTGECWEWTMGKDVYGYGIMGLSVKPQKAHRIAWFLTNGLIPPGMCVCHMCDNPGCVNPEHLFIGTHGDNMRDRENKGRARHPYGEHSGKSKLTEEQVLDIRSKYIPRKYSSIRLSKEYGVCKAAILKVVKRKTWTHI